VRPSIVQACYNATKSPPATSATKIVVSWTGLQPPLGATTPLRTPRWGNPCVAGSFRPRRRLIDRCAAVFASCIFMSERLAAVTSATDAGRTESFQQIAALKRFVFDRPQTRSASNVTILIGHEVYLSCGESGVAKQCECIISSEAENETDRSE
jgi:hypothetical protein